MFGSLKYFLFFDILILIISYTIFLRSLIIFMIILNSFSGNSHTSFLQDQFLKIYFVPLLDHASSSALLFCTDIHTSEKTVTSPSLCRLALYRERSSPINLAKDSGESQTVSVDASSLDLRVSIPNQRYFAGFFSQEFVISCSLWCLFTVLQ